jgi:SPP1 gp7 family putative phage head morphogenesis protein
MPETFIQLQPIKESTIDFERMEARIKRVFKEYFYAPLLKELALPSSIISNTRDELYKALQSGRLSYSSGTFSGALNATLTKELKKLGAKWDKKSSTFKLSPNKLPDDMHHAVSISQARYNERIARIDKRLSQFSPAEIADKLKTKDLFQSVIIKTNEKIDKSLKNISVLPELSAKESEQIAEEWAGNMDKWIVNFTEEEIKRLRLDVLESAVAGNRYEALVKTFERSYGVTQNKAKFLARQETGLLMAKFKEARYTKAGIDEYSWHTVAGSPNHPVRPSHKILEGKIFRWDTPPITTPPGEPQRRNNPGEDYNCRCYARPIVRFKK